MSNVKWIIFVIGEGPAQFFSVRPSLTAHSFRLFHFPTVDSVLAVRGAEVIWRRRCAGDWRPGAGVRRMEVRGRGWTLSRTLHGVWRVLFAINDWELINDYYLTIYDIYGRRRLLVNEVSLSCFTRGGKIGKVLMNWIKISFVVHCMSPQFFLTQVSILTWPCHNPVGA